MLILTEKESVAKNYAKALKLTKTDKTLYESADKKIKVTYAAGHLYTLYDAEDYNVALKKWDYKTLPYIPKEYKFKPIADKGRTHTRIETEKQIRKAVKANEEIVIATDPDREGEVIARIILNKCGVPHDLIKRIWACEGVNEEEVIRSVKNREDGQKYEKLFNIGLNQKKSDWVLGINLTRTYTLLFNNNNLYSVGRVQTAVLKEIYRKECERLLFIPKTYYEIEVETEEGIKFYYNKECNHSENVEKKTFAESIFSSIKPKDKIVITDLREKEEDTKPPLLYDSASIQADAFDIYGIDVSKTLELCQSLYIEKGVATYPRTDCRFLKEEDFERIKERAEKLADFYEIKNFNKELIKKENKRYFNTSKIHGHQALIPCREYKEKESSDYKIYDLLLRRFLMMGFEDNVCNRQKAYAVCNGITLCAGSVNEIKKGWKEFDLHKSEDTVNNLKIEKEKKYTVKNVKILEKQTQKPKAYTQSTLLSYMKNPFNKNEETEGKIYSIGTQATQALIIQTLFDRKYIEKSGKSISITKKGIKLIEAVKENEVLDRNTDALSTTKWEEMNEKDPEQFLRYIEKATVDSVKVLEDKLKLAVEKNEVCDCPSCGGKIIGGKAGWYCTGYKNGCKNSISYKVMGNEITSDFVKSLVEEKKSPVMKGIKSDGSECEFLFRVNEKGEFILVFTNQDVKICNCPLCNGEVGEYPKTYRCKNEDCNFYLYKSSYGIFLQKDDVKALCEGRKIRKEMTKKDSSKCNVLVCLNETKDTLKIKYEN